MNVRFLSIAEKELDDAFHYYQDIQQGLGFRLIEGVQKAVKRIKKYPESYQSIGTYSRRCLVNKFLFGIIYQKRFQ